MAESSLGLRTLSCQVRGKWVQGAEPATWGQFCPSPAPWVASGEKSDRKAVLIKGKVWKTEQSQLLESFLIRKVLQTPHRPCGLCWFCSHGNLQFSFQLLLCLVWSKIQRWEPGGALRRKGWSEFGGEMSKGLWFLVPGRSAISWFWCGSRHRKLPTLIPAGVPVAVSLPLDQIRSDWQSEGKLSTQCFTRQTMPVVASLGLKGSSLGVLNM